MKLAAFLIVPAFFAFAAPAQDLRMIYAGMPPERFQGEFAAVTLFSDDVEKHCPGDRADNVRVLACAGWSKGGAPIVVLPNPCDFPTEKFAVLACHEGAHINAWPADHPR